LLSVVGCESSGFVVTLVMAWSPARRSNAGRFEVEHPGDYAAFNSYQPGYGTPCRFADHPTEPLTLLHRLIGIARNRRSGSIGTTDRDQSERVIGMGRYAHPPSPSDAPGDSPLSWLSLYVLPAATHLGAEVTVGAHAGLALPTVGGETFKKGCGGSGGRL
jgi:hypothetical protein